MSRPDPDRRAAGTAAAASRGAAAKRWIKWLLLGAVVAGLMYACRGEKTYRWEEEVVLGSGERLLLDRSIRLERISAPFNPFQTSWAWRESTIVVREGPPDVKGARYEAWLLPMLIERDQGREGLVVVGIPVNCDAYKAYRPDRGWLYLAFHLQSGQPTQQVPIPDWAWGRRLNLLKPNSDKAPPRRVNPDFTGRFNREESRGEINYFEIRSITPTHCR